jgi:acyl carrier protein
MTDETARICLEVFRETTGLDNSKRGAAASDEEMMAAPIDSFNIDSLETMEFVMAVEDRFDVLLNEQSVNSCKTLTDFAKLVAEARGV